MNTLLTCPITRQEGHDDLDIEGGGNDSDGVDDDDATEIWKGSDEADGGGREESETPSAPSAPCSFPAATPITGTRAFGFVARRAQRRTRVFSLAALALVELRARSLRSTGLETWRPLPRRTQRASAHARPPGSVAPPLPAHSSPAETSVFARDIGHQFGKLRARSSRANHDVLTWGFALSFPFLCAGGSLRARRQIQELVRGGRSGMA
ncbi:hypothetical protein C8R44DRAFT_888519 [Mycena epipterygia]|nr:hypothetical protein C8R44DRAFT_888519 [Mycena epipterygia]